MSGAMPAATECFVRVFTVHHVVLPLRIFSSSILARESVRLLASGPGHAVAVLERNPACLQLLRAQPTCLHSLPALQHCSCLPHHWPVLPRPHAARKHRTRPCPGAAVHGTLPHVQGSHGLCTSERSRRVPARRPGAHRAHRCWPTCATTPASSSRCLVPWAR